MSLNLEKQLTFYGAYHHNPVNVAIHMACVPLILATSIFILSNTPALVPLPSWLTIPSLPLNVSTIGSILYSGFYVLLEPVAGTITVPLIMGWAAFSNHFIATTTNISLANKAAGALFVLSWIMQFLGHGAYEKRAPALLDNLVQALVLAPFFVFMELLFKFGYRPELQKRINTAVETELAKLKTGKANGAAKNGKAH